MVEETEEGEGTSRSGSAAAPPPPPPPPPPTDAGSSLPPRKRLLTGLKQNGWTSPDSGSSASLVGLRKPNFSDCHACGSRRSSIRGKDKIQTLDSQWRIVLLCKKCFDGVESAKKCSYCFIEMAEVGVSCRKCERRVHEGCVSNYQGFGMWSDSGTFTCIDCWVPKSLNGTCRSRNPNGGSKIVSDACSVKNSRVSSAFGVCSRSLENVVKDANSTAETKISMANKAREKALRKAVVARRAAELARDALDLAVVAAREDTKVKVSLLSSNSVVDDAELAFRLHRVMNSSARIAKNSCSVSLECLVSAKTRQCNGNSLARESDPGSPSVCGKLEVCTENKIFENPDKTVSEPSVCIGTSDHDPSIDSDFLEAREKLDTRTCPQNEEWKHNGEEDVMGNFERGSKAGLIKMSESEDNKIELPAKEEQASCSNKVINSSGDDNNMDSESQSSQKHEELEHQVSSRNRVTQCRSACDGDFSAPEKKRGHGPDRYLRKYSKRHSSLKAVLDRKTKFLYEDFPLESQASATGLPLFQLNCSKASRTFSDASFQSPSVPTQPSACASGPSGHQL